MNCKTCAAYQPGPNGAKNGMCRLRAPVSMLLNIPAVAAQLPVFSPGGKNGQPMQGQPQQMVQGFFPPVHEDIWCLEYQQRPQPEDRPSAQISPS